MDIELQRDVQHEHDQVVFAIYPLDIWMDPNIFDSFQALNTRQCVSKMMDPKKYPGNGQPSLIL